MEERCGSGKDGKEDGFAWFCFDQAGLEIGEGPSKDLQFREVTFQRTCDFKNM